MHRITLIISILLLGAANADARTFNPTPYIAEANVDVLTKNVANGQFGRDLFGNPYATVVVGNVDVYDRFPYIEARYFQIVSDPNWNRLLMGEVGRGLVAFNGKTDAMGALDTPRGLSSDAQNRIYVADTGNDRVLVYQTVSEFDQLSLQPLFSIDGLSQPYDVAYSDGGTPFDNGDDCLYVANSGMNEVRRYGLADGNAKLTDSIGELGSGSGFFAGPMAVTAGRRDGVHNGDVYVSDAHNSRVVRLQDAGGSLVWAGSVPHKLGVITSLDTDHWGNVYAAAPQIGTVTKFTAALAPLASYVDIKRPRSFHVPFANVTDHRTGKRSRAGQGSGVLVEEWGGESGLRMVSLGVEMNNAAVRSDASVSITLTDHAAVTAQITDPRTGIVIARHDAGVLAAGSQTIRFSETDYVAAWNRGEYAMTVRANSTYDQNATSEVALSFEMESAGSPTLPAKLTSLGNTPNPFNPSTTIRFMVPSGPNRDFNFRVYDVRGRLVRRLASGQISAGLQEVPWDGRNDNGDSVSSGVYLYRVDVGQERFTGKMVLVK